MSFDIGNRFSGFASIARNDPAQIELSRRYDFNSEQLSRWRARELRDQLHYLGPKERTLEDNWRPYNQFNNNNEPAMLQHYRARLHAYTESQRDDLEQQPFNQPADRKIEPLVRFKILRDMNEVTEKAINFLKGGAGASSSLVSMAKEFQNFLSYLREFGSGWQTDRAFKVEFDGKLIELDGAFERILDRIQQNRNRYPADVEDMMIAVKRQLRELLDFGQVMDSTGFSADGVQPDPTIQQDALAQRLRDDDLDNDRLEQLRLLRKIAGEDNDSVDGQMGDSDDDDDPFGGDDDDSDDDDDENGRPQQDDSKEGEEEQKENKSDDEEEPSDSEEEEEVKDDSLEARQARNYDRMMDELGDGDPRLMQMLEDYERELGEEEGQEEFILELDRRAGKRAEREVERELERLRGDDVMQPFDLEVEGNRMVMKPILDDMRSRAGELSDVESVAKGEIQSAQEPGKYSRYNARVRSLLQNATKKRLTGSIILDKSLYDDYKKRRAKDPDAPLIGRKVLRQARKKKWITRPEAHALKELYKA